MMQYEFEKLAGREVTPEQYRALEILYNETDLDKDRFVESVRVLLDHIPKPVKPGQFVYVALESGMYDWHRETCRDRYGKIITVRAEVLDVEISTGSIILKKIPDIYFAKEFSEIDFYEYDKRIVWEEWEEWK